ncbi:MAG: R2-like ligand-binding oxidase [Fimbriimonadales bacterium]|jgi:ribonucleoside-diphosphate reductase beta chain|nr:R2-like ligand-binding oxidase [Fimbriimonadales bacterium]GBC91200.1 R2-like ligand binding oxidase [bacterium HR14]CUU11196.1 ribonucleoside-diphosphate reductase beta chain [Armatimonadetes bacterium GBS]CUU36014.1 ribonucleoside-diphosphate reductase beta chain [Armatimonadetes bacterium GXS]
MKTHSEFLTTSARGLNHNHPMLKMFQKAKKLGVWDPAAIDLSQDREHWQTFTEPQKDATLRLISLFQAGEESVTLDLLPLIQVIAEEGRLEEEMYLTSFLFEEAKHVEFMNRFLTEVAEVRGEDLSRYHTPSYRAIFYEALPQAMHRLTYDRSPVAQAEASVVYNMIVEGVLAETGYYGFFQAYKRQQVMPGLVQGIGKMMQDESRHIAFGVYFLSRLIAEHGDPVWEAIQNKMNELLPYAVGVVQEVFQAYEPEMPFGLEMDEFMNYAMTQFMRRENRLARARTLTLEQLYQETEQAEAEAAELTRQIVEA